MKNKFVRLSAVMLTAGFLSSSGAFAQSIQVDEYNFLFPTNQLNEEANALAVRALGFATNNFSATVANETATAFGSADVFGEWIATTPFANGQVQVFNFNIFDPAYEGGGLSDTLSIVLSGRQPTVLDPNNMTINFSFRSDNLSGTPALGALFGGISITESGYFQSVNAFLPAQFVGDVAAPLTVSFRSDVVPEPSAIQFGLLSLASLPFLLRLRNKR